MTPENIAAIRLYSQQIAGTRLTTAKSIVSRMGAMQAQDYTMSKWGVGVRLPGSTDALIEKALAKGEILRTHVLRPTWHLVSPDNIGWMRELSAPQIKTLMRSNNKKLGLTDAVFSKSNGIIEKALGTGKHLTREELLEPIGKAKIALNENRAAHLLIWAELDGLICSGAMKDKKQTYAALPERASGSKKISREEACGKLAKIYFSSHCPATLKDFIWWSGLPVADAKVGLEMIKKEFVPEIIEGETYWMHNGFSLPEKDKDLIHLLPAFDELIISYKDRRAVIEKIHQKKAFTTNGLFRPVILVNGQATGLWKRTFQKDKVLIETEFFKPHSKAQKGSIEKAAQSLGKFLEKKVELKFV